MWLQRGLAGSPLPAYKLCLLFGALLELRPLLELGSQKEEARSLSQELYHLDWIKVK